MPTSLPDPLVVLLLTRLPDDTAAQVRAIHPAAQVRRVDRSSPEYRQSLAEAHVICGGVASADFPHLRRLRWIQLSSAGAVRYAQELPHDVLLTNARGIYGIPISEHVLAMMLALVRRLPQVVRGQVQEKWQPLAVERELYDSTCCVLGLGDIGLAVAERAKAMGMWVLAVKRRVKEKPACVDELGGPDGLGDMLGRTDHLVVTLPGTANTHHMVGRAELAKLKRGACVYNVGRGSVIDEAALAEALASGHLAGAGLDVFDTEPLPATSPLWPMPNVIVSPHMAGGSPRGPERLGRLFLDNLQRFVIGQEMHSVVDREQGY